MDPYVKSLLLLDEFQKERNDVFEPPKKIKKYGRTISEIYDDMIAPPKLKKGVNLDLL
jgi:hypothetical protein